MGDDGPDHQVRSYVRHERLVPADRLEAVVAELLEEVAGAGDTGASPDGVRDVLVCTHGSRDVCCGSDGVNLYRDLKALALPGVRVWRTSHTGGHRFAPTAVTFPDGRAWAWLDAELLAGIVTRTAAAGVAARHDRGSTALPDPFAQAADAAVLGVEGWAWLDHPRTAEVAAVDGDGHRVVTLTVQASAPTASADTPPTASTAGPKPAAVPESPPAVSYRAEVVVKRVVPVPDCGRPLDEARKSSPDVEVVALVRQGTEGRPPT